VSAARVVISIKPTDPDLRQLPPRRCSTCTPPVQDERHDDRADERADDSTRSEGQAVSREEADEEPADEGADDAGRKCESPVDTLRRPADDELRGGADEHSEQDYSEQQHAEIVFSSFPA
jgi:hypothetical protein